MMEKNIKFIKKYFRMNKKPNFEYSWNHAFRTAKYLEKIILKYSEVEKEKKKDIFYAALGHDLLEDTPVKEEAIRKKWGKTALSYIRDLTNRQGDDDFGEYMEKLKKSEEEVLLIKLADICDNAGNSIREFKNFSPDWMNGFWIPLLMKYKKELFSLEFRKYPRTASAIIKEINDKIKILKSIK